MGSATTVAQYEAFLSLRDEFTSLFGKALGEGSKEIKKFSKEASDSLKAIGEVGGLIGASVVGAAAAILELGERGAKVADVQRNFQGLAGGVDAAKQMIDAMRNGVQGTVSDFDLMKTANKAMGDGLHLSASQMGDMMGAARELAKRVGLEGGTAAAVDELTRAMATGRVKALAQLGVMVDSKKAVYDYQVATGQLGLKLDDTQKRAAIQAATMKALEQVLKDAGPQALDFGEKIEVMKVNLVNFTDKLAVAVAESPVLAAGLDAVQKAVIGAFGGNQANAVKFVLDLINKFAIGLVDVASAAVEGARYITNAWNGLKLIFAGVMYLFIGQYELLAKSTQYLIDMFAKLPGAVGAPFRAMQQTVHDTSNYLEGMRKSFGDQAKEAIDDAAKENHAFDQVQAALGTIKTAMVAASQQQDKHIEGVRVYKRVVDDLGAAIGHSVAFTEMWATAQKALAEAQAMNLAPLDREIAKIQAETAVRLAGIEVKAREGKLRADEAAQLQDAAKQFEALTIAEAKHNDLIAHQDELRAAANVYKDYQQQLFVATHTGSELRLGVIAYEKAQALATLDQQIRSAQQKYRDSNTEEAKETFEVLAKAGDSITAYYRHLQIGEALKESIGKALASLPQTILDAIKGGGDVLKSVGSLFGSNIFSADSKLVKDATSKLTGALHSTVGGALGSVIPGLGTLLGEGLGSIAGKIFGGIFGGEAKKVRGMRDAWIDQAGGLDVLKKHAEEANVSIDKLLNAKKVTDYQKALTDLQAAFQMHDDAVKGVNDAMTKYGITVDEMGPKWAKQELDKKAMDLLKDYDLLTAAGGDQIAVITKMGPALEDYVKSSLKAGTTIPENLKPALQQMAEMGTLTDAAGNKITDVSKLNFSATLTDQVKDLISSIQDLVAALTGIPKKINTDITTTYGGGSAGAPSGYGTNMPSQADIERLRNEHRAAAGFQGWVTKPTRFLAGEAGPEYVSVVPQGRSGGGRAGGAGVEVTQKIGEIHNHVYAAPGQSPTEIAAAVGVEMRRNTAAATDLQTEVEKIVRRLVKA